MNAVRRFPLVTFFLLAFLLSWSVWGTSIAQARGIISFRIPQPLAFWVGLTIAAYGTAALSGGWCAVKDLLLRLVRWRVNPLFYPIALLVTALLTALAIGIYAMLGGAWHLGNSLPLRGIPGFLLFYIFFFVMTEEAAWRGFALPRLQARYDALTASLILGVLWGVWHLPLWFTPGSFQTFSFPGFLILTVAMSIITTWLFNNTRGSVLLCGILHAATNAAIAFSNVLTCTSTLFWIFVAVEMGAAVAITLTQGARRLSQEDPGDEIAYQE